MNSTTHKLLMHGCQISKIFPLPKTYFSEDCSEAWHKLHRKNMTERSRQNNRQNRILDVFNRAVYLSDPKISLTYLRNHLKFHKERDMPEDVEPFFNN